MSSVWKRSNAPSIPQYGYAVKHAIRQLKQFYCTLCGPASGFQKAVSVYHTWLSNNPVVGQTTVTWRYISRNLALVKSIRPSLPTLPFLLIYFSLCSPCISYTLGQSISHGLTHLPVSSVPVSIPSYPLLCCLKRSLFSVLTLYPLPLFRNFCLHM